MGVLWSKVRPEDFVLIDFNGQILKESAMVNAPNGHVYRPDISAVKIHCAIHRILGNGRAKAVFHTHQHYATVLTCLNNNTELEMVHQNSARFHKSVCYYREYNGIVDNDTEGINLANNLIAMPQARVM